MGGSRHNWVAIRAVVVASGVVAPGAAPQHTSLSGAEPRSSIELSAKERQRLRAGMRVYLECVQGVTDALGDSKMGGAARSAKRCGMGMVDDVFVHGRANAAAGVPRAEASICTPKSPCTGA